MDKWYGGDDVQESPSHDEREETEKEKEKKEIKTCSR